jgi:intracellular sulfur oxidation DsrE/DsrF family protein
MDLDSTPRRGFLAGLGALAALTVNPGSAGALVADSEHDRWLGPLKGKYRQLFDFNAHGDGLPMIHMHNFIETLKSAYGAKPADINVVGTFYGGTTVLAWNDAMWAKYKIGTALNLTDPETKSPVARNWFFQPKKTDPVFLNGMLADASIQNLTARGATFLMCNNAFRFWTMRLAGLGLGRAEDIAADIKANLLPGVVIVPAMVIAIGAAQQRGLTYMRT